MKQYVDLEVKKSKQHGDLAVLFYVDFTEHEQGEKTKLQTCLCHGIPKAEKVPTHYILPSPMMGRCKLLAK